MIGDGAEDRPQQGDRHGDDGDGEGIVGRRLIGADLSGTFPDGQRLEPDGNQGAGQHGEGRIAHIVEHPGFFGFGEVFEHEEAALILEDDCLPLNGFFEYCKTMLEYYKDAPQIMMVNGSNLVPRKNYEIKEDYTFSANSWVWGWATWKRAWKLYDPEIKNWPYVKKNKVLNGIYNSKYRFKKEISKGLDLVYKHKLDTWDYQWQFAIWINYGLCIVPRYNYVENLGFDIKEATHTCDEMPAYLKKVYAQKNETINMQLDGHYIVRNVKLDAAFDRMLFLENYSLKSILRKVKNLLGLK